MMLTEEREEMKAYAISSLLAGDSYRKTQANIRERFKEDLSLQTLHKWFHNSPEFDAWSGQQMKAMLEQNFRIRTKATQLLDERLDQEPDTYKLNAVKGTAEDKIIAMAKLSQDAKNSNLLQQALKHALSMPQDQRLSLASSISED